MKNESSNRMPFINDKMIPPDDILIVDDEIPNLKLLAQILAQEDWHVRPVERPQLAINAALEQPPALILLDVRMPEMDGFEVCRLLKQDERTRDVPVIFISALQDVEDKVRGFEAGGVDFVSKPFQEGEVLARVRTHLALHNMQLHLEELVNKRTARLSATNEALVESEAKYRDLVNNSLVGVFNSSLDGQFLFVNDALVRMYDFDHPEQMLAEGSQPRWVDPKEREQLMSDLREHGSVSNFEAETITATGRHNHVLFSVKLQGEVISGMVMDITERRQAEKRILADQEKLRAMASELIIVEERERKRIASDLHDGPTQSLGLARMQLAEVAEAIAGSEPGNILDEASRQIRRALEQIREILLDLSSPALHQMGLAAGLSEWLDEHVRGKQGLKVVFLDECGNADLTDDIRLFVFRNVCELLTNVVKHARAQRVTVSMTCAGPTVQIVVEDDGLGFDPASVKSLPDRRGGFGLFSVAQRMADLGGSLEMVSEPGKGCRATLVVPLESAGQRVAQ
jgi:PAS domain S-box-containing protein